jgi:nitroreductase
VQDCSAAVQNILISANDLGLGTCWTAAYPLEDRAEGFRKLLSLPEGVVALALITLGYPAERPVTEKRYKKERIHYNKW